MIGYGKAVKAVKAMMVRLILIRAALWILVLLYLLGAIFSHSIPVSIKLEGDFGWAGWIAQQATSCLKFDHWKMSGGHFYRQHPFDSQGNDDPGAAWAEISRPEYVAEVGTRLRELMPFGVIALCIAYVLSRISVMPPGKWDKLPDAGPKLENLVLSARSSGLRLEWRPVSEVTEKVRAGSPDPANAD